MKKLLPILIGLTVFLSFSARAQVFSDKHEYYVSTMDRTAVQHSNRYANVPIPGAGEDIKPQALRYNETITPVDNAIIRHFNVQPTDLGSEGIEK